MKNIGVILLAIMFIGSVFAEDGAIYSSDMKSIGLTVEGKSIASLSISDVKVIDEKAYFTSCDLLSCSVYVNSTMIEDVILDDKSMPTMEVIGGEGKIQTDGIYILEDSYREVCHPTYGTAQLEEDIWDNKTNDYTKRYYNATVQLKDECKLEDIKVWNTIEKERKLMKGVKYQFKINYIKSDGFASGDLVFSFFGVKLDELAWWNAAWSYRKAITVTNPLAWNMYNYSAILIQITYNAHMQADFDDLRFVFVNATDSSEYLLKAWLENKTDSTIANVWVNVSYLPASGTSTVRMYYGNGAATNYWDGNNTFRFFDHFDSALDTSVWQRNFGWAETSSSYLNICNTTGGEGISLSRGAVWPWNQHARWSGYVVTSAASPGFIGWGDSYRDATSGGDGAAVYYYNSSGYGGLIYSYKAANGEENKRLAYMDSTIGSVWTIDLRRNSTSSTAAKYRNDSYINYTDDVLHVPSALLNFTLYDRSSVCVAYDWIAIGNYTESGGVDYPTSAFGGEESVGLSELTTNFSAVDWETNMTWMNASVNLPGTLSMRAWLNCSGVLRDSTNKTDGAGQFDFNTTFRIPLVPMNNTGIPCNWYYENTTTLGSSNVTGAGWTQQVYWSYYPYSWNITQLALETQILYANLTYVDMGFVSPTFLANGTFNGTAFPLTYISPFLFNGTTFAPSYVTPPNQTLSSYGNLTVNYGGTAYVRNSTYYNITNVLHVSIDNCTTPGALNFTAVDESTGARVNFDLDIVLTLWVNSTSSLSFTDYSQNNTYRAFCIDPSSFTGTITASATYNEYGTVAYRGYTGTYTSISNTSYLNITLLTVNGSYYVFTVTTQYGVPIWNANITATRGGVITETRNTNPDGTQSLLFKPFVVYVVNVTKAGYLPMSFNFTPTTITSVGIRMTPDSIPQMNTSNEHMWSNVTYWFYSSPFNNGSRTYNTSFFISYNVSSPGAYLSYWGISINRTWSNGTNFSTFNVAFLNSTNATGGNFTYAVTLNGTYQITAWFKHQNYTKFVFQDSFFYLNGTNRYTQLRDIIPYAVSGWGYQFMVIVFMIGIMAYVSYLGFGEAAWVFGLAVMGLFTLFNFQVMQIPMTLTIIGVGLYAVSGVTANR